LDVGRYELRRSGHILKLEKIPMELLILLVSRKGELVSREQIIAKLWGHDVFIETEHGINTAVKKVRQTLGDDPENSRFVQTVVGKGYRFIATVTNGEIIPAIAQGRDGKEVEPTSSAGNLTRKVKEKSNGKLIGVAVAVLLSLLGIAGWRVHRDSIELPPLEIVPLVALSGYEAMPSFSPDGNQVAFVLEGTGNSGIYTALVDGEKALRLTSNSSDRYPVWSPDGKQVAFARSSEEGQAIYLIPSFGGNERRIYTGPAGAFPRSLSWAPSGEVLAFSESSADRTHARISQLSIGDSSIRPLTLPSDREIDYAPAFSPDGLTLAFVRSAVTGDLSDLYTMPAKGGEAKRITYLNRGIAMQLSWTADSGEIVFCSDPRGAITLWRVAASGGTPRPIEGVGAGACGPAISRKGHELAYQHELSRDGIWRLKLDDPTHGHASAEQVVSAKGQSGRPDFSPDGKKFSFESDRLGYHDIWVCDSDGSNCGQATSLHGEAGVARWSPDGRHIAFEYRPKDHGEIFLMDVPGGSPRLLPTLPGSDNGGPSWSRDGKWIYFCSDKGGGPLQLWKVPYEGGVPIRVTSNGGVFATESVDRRFVYYSKWNAPGVWEMPMEGGPESRILDQPDGTDWSDWGVTSRGIYFVDSHAKPATINFFEFATGKQFPVFVPPQQPGVGLAASRNGDYILYSEVDLAESSIVLVKNFH
jgi:Tol biopolymer transport system component/DNA-binding winged helix-turn-helix (wHTH) protein